MRKLYEQMRELQRVLIAFSKLNCTCGDNGKIDLSDHMEYCKYFQALQHSSDGEPTGEQRE